MSNTRRTKPRQTAPRAPRCDRCRSRPAEHLAVGGGLEIVSCGLCWPAVARELAHAGALVGSCSCEECRVTVAMN